jgi:hypothetical protein
MNTSKSQSFEQSRTRRCSQTELGKSRELGSQPMTRFDGASLLKRQLRDAGIVGDYSPHSFRATGITNYLEHGYRV